MVTRGKGVPIENVENMSLKELFYDRRGGYLHTYGTALAGAAALFQFVLPRMALSMFRMPDARTLGYSSVLLTPVVLVCWALAGGLLILTAAALGLLVVALLPYTLILEGTATIVSKDWEKEDEGWSRTGGKRPYRWEFFD